MSTGTVVFFNREKGFGFVKPDEGGRDVFVHETALRRAGMASYLEEGERLGFEIEADPKNGKPRAVDLRPAPVRPMAEESVRRW